MKFNYFSRGFIDPRRPDTITVKFEKNITLEELGITEDELKQNRLIFLVKRFLNLHHLEVEFFKNNPWFLEGGFGGREQWLSVDGYPAKLTYFSGNGPEPAYPVPEGEIVHLIINLK